MSVSTTQNLLDAVKQFHEKVGLYCEKNARINKDERVRMLLDYIGRHEYHLAEALDAYQGEARNKVLNTWFRNVPEKLAEVPGEPPLTPDSTAEEVITWAIKMDDSIIELYRSMAEEAEIADVRKVVNSLLAMEDREKLKMVRSSLRINDM